MTSTTLRAAGYRLADTRLGDTIQAIAQRELGDAARWTELVAYNRLAPPYIVDSLGEIEGAGSDGIVILAGERIRIPAARQPNAVADPADVFGIDLDLADGLLGADDGGDLLLIADTANLSQALRHRLATHEGELIWHPDYGNRALDLVGEKGNPVNDMLAAAYSERALRSDPRIDRVDDATATFDGDATTVDATAIAVDGRPLPVGSKP